MNHSDEIFMKKAIAEAKKAAEKKETPIGAVIVKDGKVIARGHNLRETKKNALLHAETVAIEKACKKLGGWRLIGCTIYVTLEPCPMCAGAILNSRIGRVVIGAMDHRFGAMGSVCDLSAMPFNHSPEVSHGVCEDECVLLLRDFFRALRKERKENPRPASSAETLPPDKK